MILSDQDIRQALKSGRIRIDPEPPESAFQTSSVDLTFGGGVHVWKKSVQGRVIQLDDFSFASLAREGLKALKPDSHGRWKLKPGMFCLALTRERLEIPSRSRLAARIEGRSSLARLGISVHMTAPTIHADTHGRITLEILNHGPFEIWLREGDPFCQLVFEELSAFPAKRQKPTFSNQRSVKGKV